MSNSIICFSKINLKKNSKYNFVIDSKRHDEAIIQVPENIKFFITRQCKEKHSIKDFVNPNKIRNQIQRKLLRVKFNYNCPLRPQIHHLGFAVIFPNKNNINQSKNFSFSKKLSSLDWKYKKICRSFKVKSWKYYSRYLTASRNKIYRLFEIFEIVKKVNEVKKHQ